MSQQSSSEQPFIVPEQGQLSLQQRGGRLVSRLGLAAVCAFPVVDIATSDALTVKAYEYTQNEVRFSSPLAERIAVNGIISLGITAQCVGVSLLLAKNKRLSGAFEDYDTYTATRQETMTRPRKLASQVANAPFKAIGKAGAAIERGGQIIEKSNSTTAKKIGRLVADAGKVNAMGPPFAVLTEIADNNPPSSKRVMRLSALFGATWIGMAEGVRQLYRHVPLVRPPFAAIGESFQALTTINLSNPLETPIGTGAISTAAFLLAANGWNIARYHEQKEAAETSAIA